MKSNINVSKIKECDQIWDAMELCENGRLCSKCDRIIFDLRGKSEWEIALKHAQSENKICGIYDKKLINKNDNLIPKKANNNSLIIAGTVGILATGCPAYSQNLNEQIKTEFSTNINQDIRLDDLNKQDNQPQLEYSKQIDSTYLLKGILTEEKGEPIIGGTIHIKGTDKGVVTDFDGKFTINVTEDVTEQDSIIIVASYIGYGREEKSIFKIDFDQKNLLELQIIMNEQIELTVFTVKRPPFHKRIWYGIKNIFRKKK